MKKKIINLLILVIVFIAIDLVFYLFLPDFSIITFRSFRNLYSFSDVSIFILIASKYVYFFVTTLIVFLIIENFLYKTIFNFKSNKLKVLLCIFLPILFSFHIAGRITTINYFYFYKKLTPPPAKGLWEYNTNLGHKSIPNASDYYVNATSMKGLIPICFNDRGFRTVSSEYRIESDTTNLFLGCSFTFGGGIIAEKSYTYLVSKQLGHDYINGGFSGYGLGQMKQFTDSLIPNNKFKYVFIQMSPWLANRAMKISRTSANGYKPYPYFSDNENGTFRLNSPAFNFRECNMKISNETEYSYLEKFLFFFNEGFSVEICDYYSYLGARVRSRFNIINPPTTRKKELEKYFYNYAIEKCIKYDCTPIILKLRYKKEDCSALVNLIESKKVLVIDLDCSLDSIAKNRNYDSLFHLNSLNSHPNNYSNELFSKTIIKNIK